MFKDYLRRTFSNIFSLTKLLFASLSVLFTGNGENIELPPFLCSTLSKMCSKKLFVSMVSFSVERIEWKVTGIQKILTKTNGGEISLKIRGIRSKSYVSDMNPTFEPLKPLEDVQQEKVDERESNFNVELKKQSNSISSRIFESVSSCCTKLNLWISAATPTVVSSFLSKKLEETRDQVKAVIAFVHNKMKEIKIQLTDYLIHLQKIVTISVEDVYIEAHHTPSQLAVFFSLSKLSVEPLSNEENDQAVRTIAGKVSLDHISLLIKVSPEIDFVVQLKELGVDAVYCLTSLKATAKLKLGNLILQNNFGRSDFWPVIEVRNSDGKNMLEAAVDMSLPKPAIELNVLNEYCGIRLFPEILESVKKLSSAVETGFPNLIKSIKVQMKTPITNTHIITKDCWKPKPWKERFPGMEAILSPGNENTSIKPSDAPFKKLSASFKNISVGILGDKITESNNRPLILLELNANVHSSEIPSKLVGGVKSLQLSYRRAGENYSQRLIEKDGLGINVELDKKECTNVSVDIPERIEMLITIRLMETALKIADAFFPNEEETSGGDNNVDSLEKSPYQRLCLRNALPFNLLVTPNGNTASVTLQSGQTKRFADSENVATFKFAAQCDYVGKEYRFEGALNELPEEGAKLVGSHSCVFETKHGDKFKLGVHVANVKNDFTATVFSPFWVVNNTGLDLMFEQLDGSNNSRKFSQPKEYGRQPILLEHGSKQLKIWSQKEDLVGKDWTNVPLNTTGRITCVNADYLYSIGVDVHHNVDNLSRQIILTPYYLLSNSAPFAVKVREEIKDQTKAHDWITIEPQQTVPFWPTIDGIVSSRSLVFKMANSSAETAPISYGDFVAEAQSSTMPIEGEAGLLVDFRATTTSMLIVCGQIAIEDVPVVLLNTLDHDVQFCEAGSSPFSIASQYCSYFSWSQPVNRSLAILHEGKPVIDDIFKNPDGSLDLDPLSRQAIYWTTFHYGRHNVLLITSDAHLAGKFSHDHNEETPTIRLHFTMYEFGLNLYSHEEKDLLYFSINSKNSLPGVGLDFVLAPHYNQIDLKIQTLYLDCQMDNAIYEAIIREEPSEREGPFVYLCLAQTFSSESKFSAHFQVVKLDLGPLEIAGELQVISILWQIMAPHLPTNENSKFETQTAKEVILSKQTLLERTEKLVKSSAQYVFDDLEFKAPKIILSTTSIRTMDREPIINAWLESMGHVLDAEDIVFEFEPFTLNHVSLSWKQFCIKAMTHVFLAARNNAIPLAMGMSNFGKLALKVNRGIKFVIAGPIKEMKETEADLPANYSVYFRNFCTQWVSGGTGFIANVLDALGKGADSVTSDFKSQMRRVALKRWSKDKRGKIRKSFRALIEGCTAGCTGLISEPVKGSRKTGCKGAIAGFVRGTVGCFVKPCTGCLSMCAGFARTAEDSFVDFSYLARVRPPRIPRNYTEIPDYDRHDADGYQILRNIDEGRLLPTDEYESHADIIDEEMKILLLTSKRLLILSDDGYIAWEILWDEVDGPPRLDGGETDDGKIFVKFIKPKVRRRFPKWNREKQECVWKTVKEGATLKLAKNQGPMKKFLRTKYPT